MNQPSSSEMPNLTECGRCHSKPQDCYFLHHVRLRGIYRRYCTSCLLILHPSSFCPSCFAFYDSSPPPPSKRLTCSNCSSFTHSQCLLLPPSPSFLCPPCSHSNFSFFHIDPTHKVIDKNMAAALLCAARIASASMAKAVTVARVDCERRAREAAVCRKRAREALEHVALLANNTNQEKPLPVLKRKGQNAPASASAPAPATTNNGNANGNDNFGNSNSNSDSNVRVKEEAPNSLLPNNSVS